MTRQPINDLFPTIREEGSKERTCEFNGYTSGVDGSPPFYFAAEEHFCDPEFEPSVEGTVTASRKLDERIGNILKAKQRASALAAFAETCDRRQLQEFLQ